MSRERDTNKKIRSILKRRNIIDDSVSEKLDFALRTKLVTILFLTMLLIPQCYHTAYVFNVGSHGGYKWYAWSYAIGIEGAILIFVINGWRWVSIGLSLATILTNYLYGKYGPTNIPHDVNLTISVLLGIVIAGFSHLYYNKLKEVQKAIRQVEDEEAILDGMETVTEREKIHECPQCGEKFETKAQLNGHITGHKKTHPHLWANNKYLGKEKIPNTKSVSKRDNSVDAFEKSDSGAYKANIYPTSVQNGTSKNGVESLDKKSNLQIEIPPIEEA